MEHRLLSRLERSVSVVGLGAWQLGADWGEVSDSQALATLNATTEAGTDFIDTSDVYGDGRSERLIGEFLKANPGTRPTVATKMGQRLSNSAENYTLENFREWTDRSRANLGVEQLDLVQLHCPPDELYDSDSPYENLDRLVEEGAASGYGFSVSTCEQALKAISRPGVASIQIILNAFRLKPLEQVLPAAAAAGVGVIVRLPLASGLLAGRIDSWTEFAEDDHRSFNRDGDAFDVGETFSGVPLQTGIEAVRELEPSVPTGLTMA